MSYSLKTRVLSMLLALVLVIGLVPVLAFATEAEESTTPETVNVKFDVNGGIGEYDDQVVILGGKIAKPEEDPTHETAVFAYWTAYPEANEVWNFEENVVTEAMTLYAVWEATSEESQPEPLPDPESQETIVKTVSYTVEHYLQTAEGYELDAEAIETLTGEVGATTVAEAKTYEGYTAQPFDQGVIAEDGTTVVAIYYNKDPVVVAATANGLPSDMTMVSNKVSTLAPGIVERQIAAYDKNGDNVLMYVATADMAVDTVEIYANYQNNVAPPWGMQKTTEQAAAFEANHEGKDVVVAINASYFNTGTGQPIGAFAMEGKLINDDAQGNSKSFFAIMKDGSAMIGSPGEYTSYKDQIQEAIGGQIHLVKNGEICSNLNTVDKYPRQTIGITAEGKVIIMTADCFAPVNSVGLTVYEQAEVMLALGCVEAVHLDGGGSGTYCSQPAGSDKLEVTSNPSNGTERAVSSTLIVVSTAKADGEFDSAVLNAEHEYVTPGSVVNISAVGLDASKGPAEIPADVIWQLSDSTLGTVENGVFTSNGTVGSSVVQLVYKEKVVGETTIHVVNPNRLDFGGLESIVIPYGKTVSLPLKAYYGVNEVYYNTEDFVVTLADASHATVDGLNITAPAADSGINGSSALVSLKADETVATTATLVFGKGSEVIFDFEEGTAGANTNNWIIRTHESDIANNEKGAIYIVNKDTGMVHDGEQALAFHADFSQGTGSGSNTTGYIALSLSWAGDPIDVKGAQNIGFWLYIPEDATTTEITMNTVYYVNGTPARRTPDGVDDNGVKIYTPYWSTNMEESGWHYIKADFSAWAEDALLIKDEPALSQAYKRNFFIKIYCVVGGPDCVPFADHLGDFTYYIDNVTVDYSSAVEDRELPVFGDSYVYGAGTEKKLVYGSAIDVAESNLTFAANVADNTNKNNYTGLNADSAKVYVDGNSVGATYTNGVLSSGNVVLADGYHRIKFEIADNNGNVKVIAREINVNAGSNQHTVKLVPKDENLDRLYSGSVYWVDLVSEDIANIKTIDAILNLNSIHTWELEHMVVADGFDASAYFATIAQQKENNVTISFTRNEETVDETSNVIASIPIRVWDSRVHESAGLENHTPEYMWTATRIDHRQLRVRVDKGLVTFDDESKEFFSDKIVRDHEAYTDYHLMDKTYWQERGSYHVHTAEAIADADATCTEAGYTGRTFCEVCDSVVSWGTQVDATGHTYEIGEDGILDCECGEKFTGVHTDGKEYVDGVCVADGWAGNSYYKDGVKLTGVNKVSAPDASGEFYYDFGEDGVCVDQMKFNGLFLDNEANVYRYSKLGALTSGWIMFNDEWYYFSEDTMAAVTGTYQYTDDIVYEFAETGRIIKGCWTKTLYGSRYYYGPNCYNKGWQIIDGSEYFFEDGHRLENGYQLISDDSREVHWYYFDENGVCDRSIEVPDGFYTDRKGYGYAKDGLPLYGIQTIDGETYGFDYRGYAKTGSFAGYLFGEDYKGFTGIREENGALYYYKNGLRNMAGLIEIDGDYYFASGDGKIIVDRTYYVWMPNGIIPESDRAFGADGKLLNGIVERDNNYYYYNMGRPEMAGLIEIDGDYYFAKDDSGLLVTNQTYYVWKSNGMIPESDRTFGPDGKMYNGIVQIDGGYYYYNMGRPEMAGLIEIDGDYYFAKDNKGTIITNRVYYNWKSNNLLPEGDYSFGPDGKMLDGIVQTSEGIFYYVKGKPTMAGLVEFNGAYYFARGNGEVITDQTYYVWMANGIIPESDRTFGPDGKMLDGIIERDGKYFYYNMGRPEMAGLIEINGDYYFASGDGRIITDSTYYVWKANGIIPESDRTFGPNGKMLNGIVERDGEFYYYNMGRPEMAGLIEIDGDYYFAKDSSGRLVADCTYYVWKGNGLIEESERTFGADGKLLDGFVTKNDGIYYYVDGKFGTPGLNYIDGYYYFVGYDGKLVVNQNYYVWKPNGYCMAGSYNFDAQGRIVL